MLIQKNNELSKAFIILTEDFDLSKNSFGINYVFEGFVDSLDSNLLL